MEKRGGWWEPGSDRDGDGSTLPKRPVRPSPPFYLFLDEFQDFCANDGAAKTLAQILSECRKFGLHLHLAHQTLGQVQQRVSSALATWDKGCVLG